MRGDCWRIYGAGLGGFVCGFFERRFGCGLGGEVEVVVVAAAWVEVRLAAGTAVFAGHVLGD